MEALGGEEEEQLGWDQTEGEEAPGTQWRTGEDDGNEALWEALAAVMPPQTETRCIDAECLAVCTRCTNPPELGEERDVELRGTGKQNGLKLLRALVARTPEWNSTVERGRLADATEAQSIDELASVLRSKRTSSLRKRHLLFLCRAWGYRSSIWSRRGERQREKQGAAAAPRQEQPAEPPQREWRAARGPPVKPEPDLEPPLEPAAELPASAASALGYGTSFSLRDPSPESLALYALNSLRPVLAEASLLYAGRAAQAAAEAQGPENIGSADHIGSATIAEVAKVKQWGPYATEKLGAALSALQMFESDVPLEARKRAARRQLSHRPELTQAEVFLETMRGVLMAIVGVTEDRMGGGELTPAEMIWLDEVNRGHKLQITAYGQMLAVLEAFKDSTLDAYVKAAAILLDLLAVFAAASSANSQRRELWMREFVRLRGESPRAPERVKLLTCYPGLSLAADGEPEQSPAAAAVAEGLRAFAGLQVSDSGEAAPPPAALVEALRSAGLSGEQAAAALAALQRLPPGQVQGLLATRAGSFGLGSSSSWHAMPSAQQGGGRKREAPQRASFDILAPLAPPRASFESALRNSNVGFGSNHRMSFEMQQPGGHERRSLDVLHQLTEQDLDELMGASLKPSYSGVDLDYLVDDEGSTAVKKE